MKKFLMLLAFCGVSFLNFSALADGTLKYAGPFTVNLSVVQQFEENVLVKSNLTATATSTNQALIYKNTTKKFPFNTATLIALLGNSYNQTFPTGARLATDGVFIYVTDKTGTNVIIPISSVLSVDFTAEVGTQTATVISKTTKAGFTQTDLAVGTETAYINLSYDDSALATRDGTHSVFHSTAIFNAIYSRNSATGKGSDSFIINDGAGTGTIRGTNSIIMGGAAGKASGIVPPSPAAL